MSRLNQLLEPTLSDAYCESEAGGDGGGVPIANTTSDIGIPHPKYIGFSFRGGTIRVNGKKPTRTRLKSAKIR